MKVSELIKDLQRPDGGHYNWKTPAQAIDCQVRIASSSQEWQILSIYSDDANIWIDIEPVSRRKKP